MKNPNAVALARLAKGKKKTLTSEQREDRKKMMAHARKSRWPKKKEALSMKWKYCRITDAKASKWVSGNHWVTKHDDSRVCVLGINGSRHDGLYIANPKKAREFIEEEIQRDAENASKLNEQ